MLIDALENGKPKWAPHPRRATMKEVLERVRAAERGMDERWNALPADRWDARSSFSAASAPVSSIAWGFLFDIIHHRGQITTYLRPMGSTVPQVYGPTADEP